MEEYSEVLLDTNILTLPQQYKIDIIQEIKALAPGKTLVTLEPIVQELKKLKEGRIGKQMIDQGMIQVKNFDRECTDKAIIEYALKNKTIVATNDKELKEQLRKIKIPIIYLRSRKKLEIEGI
ncbi:hypothetical protein K8R43_03400 [archaeon]|nr:hypothetical protein [archaeon]